MTRSTAPVLTVTLAEEKTQIGRLTLAVSDSALLYCGFQEPGAVRELLAGHRADVLDEPMTGSGHAVAANPPVIDADEHADGTDPRAHTSESAASESAASESARRTRPEQGADESGTATGTPLPGTDTDKPRPGSGSSTQSLALLAETRRQIHGYLSGARRSFDLPVDLRLATPFARELLTRLKGVVGYRHTISYGQLAAALDRPGAARAVGRALGSNPVCVVLPCHRVIGSSGKLTGYAGGVEAKKFLLALEAGAEPAYA
jgi:methylated-DNA-[protein]-cysteine S-methyltransferase